MTVPPRKISLGFLLVAMLAMAIGYGIYRDLVGPDRKGQTAGQGIGGSFTLVDQNGRTVTESTFRGKLMLVHFGYTYSPDISPTSLTAMGEAIDQLGKDGDEVVPVFISIDPERDTPAQLKMYASYFHPRLVALTGTPEQVAAAAKAYRIYYTKLETKGADPGDYQMEHTAIIYLMGRKGEFRAHFSYPTPAETIAARIRENL